MLYFYRLFIVVIMLSSIGCGPLHPTKESEAYVKSQQNFSLDALQKAPVCCETLNNIKFKQLAYPDYANFEINREDQAFIFPPQESFFQAYKNPSDKSFFEAFQLPPFEEPYYVIVSSYRSNGKFGLSYSSQIFYPIILFLDEEYRPVHTKKLTHYVAIDHLTSEYTIEEDIKAARYLIIYTSKEFLTEKIRLKSSGGGMVFSTPTGVMVTPTFPSYTQHGYSTNVEGDLTLRIHPVDLESEYLY